MASLFDLTARIGADISDFSTKMQKVEGSLNKLGKSTQALGKKLSTNLTLPLVGLAAVSGKVFADFEQEMAKVKAISGATGAEFESLKKNAEDLGAATRFSASQVAGLQLNLSKLGLTPKEIEKSTEAILNLSQATGEDLGQSATVAASTMKQFGLAASDMNRITDTMASGFSNSALDLDKFMVGMRKAGPAANAFGVDLETATSMLGILIDSGIDAGTAGAQLSNMFITLKKEGLTYEEAMSKIRNSTDQLTTATELFKKPGAVVAITLANNSKEAEKLESALRGSAGAAADMADTMDNTMSGSMAKMRSALEGAAISLGEVLAPMIRSVAEFVGRLAAKFKNLSPEAKKIIVVVGGLVAALGPVLIVVGKMASGFTAVSGIIKSFGGIIKKAMLAISASPMGLMMAAAAALAVVIMALSGNTDELTASQKALNKVQSQAEEAIAGEIASLDSLVSAVNDSTRSEEDRDLALQKLQATYPGYLDNLTKETLGSKEGAKAVNLLKKALLDKAKLQAAESVMAEEFKKQAKAQSELAKAQAKLNKLKKEGAIDSGIVGLTEVLSVQKQIEESQLALNESKEASTALEREFGSAIVDSKIEAQKASVAAIAQQDKLTKKRNKDAKQEQDNQNAIRKSKEVKREKERKKRNQKDPETLALEQADKASKKAAEKRQKEFNKQELALQNEHNDELRGIDLEASKSDESLQNSFHSQKLKTEADFLRKQIALRKSFGESTNDLEQQLADAENQINIKKNEENISADEAAAEKKKQILNGGLELASAITDGLTQLEDVAREKKLATLEAEKSDLEAKKEMILEEMEAKREAGTLSKEAEIAAKEDVAAIDAKLQENELKAKKEGAKKSKALALAGIIISTAQGIASAVAAGAGLVFPANLGAIASGVGAVLGGVAQAKAAISSTPALADGGLAFGATNALVGEGIGTSMNNPEVIAPLDKLKKFMGGGEGKSGGSGIAEFKIKGQDLVYVLDRANRSQSRGT